MNRQQAADVLESRRHSPCAETSGGEAEIGTRSVPPTLAPLDASQRHRIRTLGVSVFTLGQILREQGSGDCVAAYEETVQHDQHIGDTAAEAITSFNLGHAYKNLSDIRDLDAAEAAYQRSLDLCETTDALMPSRCIKQIGMVHHERFNESRAAGEPEETVLRHAQAAESHYEQAREHYEKAAQYFDQSGNRYNAGGVRYNIALMYQQSASREESSSRRGDLLRRAQAYAAALRDFQHYQGRAAADEAKAQNLIDHIQQALDQPPP